MYRTYYARTIFFLLTNHHTSQSYLCIQWLYRLSIPILHELSGSPNELRRDLASRTGTKFFSKRFQIGYYWKLETVSRKTHETK
jgi:hypothetical protein